MVVYWASMGLFYVCNYDDLFSINCQRKNNSYKIIMGIPIWGIGGLFLGLIIKEL